MVWACTSGCGGSIRKPFVFGRGNEPVSHRLLAGKLPGSAASFGFLPSRFLGRLLVKAPSFHFPKHAFALHFLLQYSKRLIDIVVSDEHLQSFTPLSSKSS
jgi:hypothetical protein